MQYIKLIEHEEFEDDFNIRIEKINRQSQKYIKDTIQIIDKEIGTENVVSIILFGSQTAKKNGVKECTTVSDCDLLVIFKDNVPNHLIKKVEKYIIALEDKHNFRELNSNNNFFDKILDVIHQTTGMFISHFLTKRQYWESIIFHKIFSVNKLFSTLFAPKKIVLCSIIANSNVIYGLDLREIVNKNVKISPFDMIKSLVMNLVISLSTIPISRLRYLNFMKYLLEAVKWSLRASNYYSFVDSPPLKEIIRRFTLLERSKGSKRRATIFYKRFLELRQYPRSDLGFMFRCPFRILKIHIKSILFKKIIRKKSRIKD
ncbi:MAG: hypothetical protein GF353_19600 [Candidatus Lokiarchaeota archaeon]|nr:hypothetical protein [Candidatus Lokiarchaeota archaeon]